MKARFWYSFALLAVTVGSAAAQSATPNWIARPDGLGPLQAGMRTASVAKLVPGTLSPEEANREDCGYLSISSVRGLSLMIFEDTVVRFDIDTTTFKTSKGIGVGSTETAVLRAYPGAKVTPHPYDGPEWHYVTVDSPKDKIHRMIFETDGKNVRSYRVGRGDAVELIEGCS